MVAKVSGIGGWFGQFRADSEKSPTRVCTCTLPVTPSKLSKLSVQGSWSVVVPNVLVHFVDARATRPARGAGRCGAPETRED
jgi:hypothetical protein